MNRDFFNFFQNNVFYKLFRFKPRFRHWYALGYTSRFLYVGIISGICSLIWLVIHRFMQGKDEKYKKMYQIDYIEKKALCERRKKGLPPGLINDGNSCFSNCILQALSSMPQVEVWMQNKLEENLGDNCYTILSSVFSLIKVLSNNCGNEDCYSTEDILCSLNSYGWVISGDQQDAYEFYQILIATIEEEVLKLVRIDDLFIKKAHLNAYPLILNRACKSLPSQKGNNHPFKGSFAIRMTCFACMSQNPVKFETFDSISLSLQNIKPYSASLEACFNEWFKPEFLHNVDCQVCSEKNKKNTKTIFSKQISFAKLPECLCIQLQRSSYNSSGYLQKCDMFINFPEVLDLFQYTYIASKTSKNATNTICLPPAPRNQSTIYKLSSLVTHYGDTNQGHFATFRRLSDKRWVYISDQSVIVKSVSDVFSSDAYMLFYEKVSK
uniref:ubiquitinyl hydrolase 1 n=1 Tax=Hydra vulgaris TaxID=6087 RepID=T2MBH0_HYDVU